MLRLEKCFLFFIFFCLLRLAELLFKTLAVDLLLHNERSSIIAVLEVLFPRDTLLLLLRILGKKV